MEGGGRGSGRGGGREFAWDERLYFFNPRMKD